MANPTFLELQQRVQARDYGSADLATVKVAINEAYETVMSSARWPFARTTTNISTVAGTASVNLTAIQLQDFGRLRSNSTSVPTPRFVDNDTTDFDLWTQKASGTAPNGVPQMYSFRDHDTIEFWPTPDAVYTYTLYYWQYPTLLTADLDEPLIPASERNVLVYGALSKLAERDRDFSGAAYHDALFQRELAGMKGKYVHTRGAMGSTRVVMPSHYNGEYGL